MRRFALSVMLAGLALGLGASPLAANPVLWTTNGHWYRLVVVDNGLTWNAARQQAQALPAVNGLPWDLATITSAAEQQFVQADAGFSLDHSTTTGIVEYWLGGYQPAGAGEPGGQWSWINGEGTFWDGRPVGTMYANWGGGVEPNDSTPGEDHLAIDNRYGWAWNDNDQCIAGCIYGYVAETVPVPEPATLSLLGLGLAGAVRAARRRKK